MNWIRSSRCSHGDCVEVHADGRHIRLRDSKRPDGPALTFDLDEWRAFMAGAKLGEFDPDRLKAKWRSNGADTWIFDESQMLATGPPMG